MRREEKLENCLSAIMELKGVGEFRETVKQLHVFLNNRETFSLTDVPLPNYLWIAKRGGGVTTLLTVFADYLHAARAIEFCGKVRSFEFMLDYVPPEDFFSELSRFGNSLSTHAGHHHCYKGVVCINIDKWIEHIREAHFVEFMDYIASNNDRLLIVFCTYSDDKDAIKTIETAIATHVRLETRSLEYPNVQEFVEFAKSRVMNAKGLPLPDTLKDSLYETIEKISAVRNFRGFKSVEQLADDILYVILTNKSGDIGQISADIIARHETLVKRAKLQIDTKTEIGFLQRGE